MALNILFFMFLVRLVLSFYLELEQKHFRIFATDREYAIRLRELEEATEELLSGSDEDTKDLILTRAHQWLALRDFVFLLLGLLFIQDPMFYILSFIGFVDWFRVYVWTRRENRTLEELTPLSRFIDLMEITRWVFASVYIVLKLVRGILFIL